MSQTMRLSRSSKFSTARHAFRRCSHHTSRIHASGFDNLLSVFSGSSAKPSTNQAPRTAVKVEAAFSPPPVADTKRKFMEAYRKPIPSIYTTVIQELLVSQHFVRYNINYQYDEVLALGFVSVFEQILDGIDESEKTKIFDAYVQALSEDPKKYRSDAAALEKWAGSLDGTDGLSPDSNGTELQVVLARVSDRAAEGKFHYSKFFAIGLFRLLELTGAKEPAALEKLVKSINVKPELVNKDLMFYKGVLSKLTAAKELMRDFLEREKKKQAERAAEKSAKQSEVSVPESQPTVQA